MAHTRRQGRRALLPAPVCPEISAGARGSRTHTKKEHPPPLQGITVQSGRGSYFQILVQLEIWEISEIWGAAFVAAGLMCGADHYVFEKAT
jgi:hypothetical protein